MVDNVVGRFLCTLRNSFQDIIKKSLRLSNSWIKWIQGLNIKYISNCIENTYKI